MSLLCVVDSYNFLTTTLVVHTASPKMDFTMHHHLESLFGETYIIGCNADCLC